MSEKHPLVEEVARAIRRRQFERTRRLGCYDPKAVLTDNEYDDARSAVKATLESRHFVALFRESLTEVVGGKEDE